MRTKITTLIATCSIAALALTVAAPTFACDQDKNGDAKVVKSGSCSSKNAAVLTVSGEGCSSKQAAVLTVKSDEGGCPLERSAKHMMAGLKKMNGCGDECPGREDMVLAVRSLATVKEGLVCEKTLASLTGEPAVLAVRTGDESGCCASVKGKGVAKVASTGAGSTCSSKKADAATLVVSKGEGSTCSSKKADAATLVVSNVEGSACSSKKADAATLVVSKGEGSTCSSKKADAATLVVSKGEGSTCSSKKADAATLVVSKGEGSTCSSKKADAATLVVSNVEGSACSSKKADAATLVVSNGKGSSCCPSTKTIEATKLVAIGSGTCSGEGVEATNARYVAFGCEKSDRIARAAAQSYLAVMTELKATSGAEGCSYSAASEVLASMLEEMRNEAQATAEAPKADATPVSLGALSGGQTPACCSKK